MHTPLRSLDNRADDLDRLLAYYSRPRGERFGRTTWWRVGYSRREVDVFADRVAMTIGSSLSSHEAHAVVFHDERGGYDFDAVDDWLAEVEELVRTLGR